jgi:hypothetical protein
VRPAKARGAVAESPRPQARGRNTAVRQRRQRNHDDSTLPCRRDQSGQPLLTAGDGPRGAGIEKTSSAVCFGRGAAW